MCIRDSIKQPIRLVKRVFVFEQVYFCRAKIHQMTIPPHLMFRDGRCGFPALAKGSRPGKMGQARHVIAMIGI